MAHAVLLDFVRAARGAGVRISTVETLDGLRSADLVGYGSRERLKLALSLALAKSADDKRLLDETFERFFTAANLAKLDDDGSAADDADANPPPVPPPPPGGAAGEAGGSGGGGGMASAESPLGRTLMDGDRNALALAMAQAADGTRLADIRLFTQRGLFGRRLYLAMGGEALDMEIIRREDASEPGEQALAAELRRRRQVLRDEIREAVQRQYLLSAAQANRELREEMIREASLATLGEFRNVDAVVRRMARKLATRHARRRRIERRGVLDVRRTLARNVRHDGILFETRWRTKRIDRPQLLVVCDVSRSVQAHARFLLMLLYGLVDVMPRIRAFAFSARLGEVTNWYRELEFAEAASRTLAQWGLGSTDYGAAFETLEELCLDAVDQRTTLIILGDARSNDSEPRVDILRRFAARARQVIWLNPEHPGRWGSGDSVMPRYRPHCTVAEQVRTLADLERVIERVLKRR